MAVDGIKNLDFRTDGIGRLLEDKRSSQVPTGDGKSPSFGEALEGALRSTEQGLTRADQAAKAYLSGEGGDLHNVMLEMQRADVQFKTMLQVRNKLVEAYREVMRMRV